MKTGLQAIGRAARGRTAWVAVAAALWLAAPAAQAQTSQDPTKANPTGPTLAVPPTSQGSDSGTDRGVIRPPQGVDPGIHQPAPAPSAGTMPVIPPPGTPGGNPNVVPK